MRVLIVGAGDIGVELATILGRREGNEVVVIESDEKRSKRMSEELDALVLHGDGTDPRLLSKADVKEADALVAVTGSDAINTVIAMLGHRAHVPKIIVKLNDVGLRAACQEIGVADIIAPKLAAAGRIVSVLYGFHHLDFSLVTREGMQLVELPAGILAGKKLSQVEIPEDALVVSVMRGGDSLLARGSTKIEEGDDLLVLVENERALVRVREILLG